MKLKKIISRILMLIFIFILGVGSTLTFAVKDESVELALSYFRYANGEPKNGYALNTTGNEGESHKPIFQIMSSTNKTNYYCLNATAGESWVNGTIGTNATYNRTYDLNLTSDINLLKNDTNSVYKNVAGSHLNQILWILDNLYVPSGDAEKDLAQKRALLAKAGIVYGLTGETDLNGNPVENYTYKYQAQTGYDYKDKLKTLGYSETTTKQGWFYYEKNTDAFKMVELTDEMIEVAGQAALWYYTNYLENNSSSSQTYNVKSQGLLLASSNGTTETNSGNWKSLRNAIFNKETNVEGYSATVGMWQEEQATILCWYLIDAADKYADSNTSVIGNPLKITPATTGIKEKQVSSEEFQVVGPIKIDEQRTAVYTLSNDITIAVDGSIKTNTGAYISKADGTKESNQNVSDYIGQEFYVAIPSTQVNGNEVKISFNGTYKTNEKKLWVNTTKTEQPVVEVTPKDETLNLTVTAIINKEFDLALRKSIIKLIDSKGNEKYVTNEEGKLATRNVTYVAEDINKNKTATYNHRKDPVVVENGDIITYSLTIYNEGDMAGYAKQITDKLPAGLTINGSEKGTTKGDTPYDYEYDADTNTITFTNKSNNILTPYNGGTTLSSETIEFECKVQQEPSSTTNIYLTNIAYISKEYNSDTQSEVEKDRDSSPKNDPSDKQELVTKGDEYTGYHGGDNNNGDNKKDVSKDGTNNDDYFPGREDDDDFEIVVVKPAEFDLALQKYISKVTTNGTSKDGRTEPKINTKKLADGTKTTADYTLDKTPIRVKQGDFVTYTFTVYNEGQIDGYVDKITDNIPTGLQFVYQKDNDGKTLIASDSQGNMTEIEVDKQTYELVSNNSYWSIDGTTNSVKKDTYNGEETISISCDVKSYLGGKNTLLKAYDSSKDAKYDGTGLDRLSVTVVLRVVAENASGITIRNEAAITEAEDSDGNKQDASDGKLKDRDSQVNKWEGKDGDKNYQDDEDYDNIILGKVDLALSKFIAAISDDTEIIDGEYLTSNGKVGSKTNPYTRATAVDTKELRDNPNCHDATYTKVKDPLVVPAKSYVLYDIRVYNEGEVDVYAGEVTDYLPDYLDFVSCKFNDNFGWKVGSDGKTIKTTYLSYENAEENKLDNLLKAFDKTTDDEAGSGLDYRDLQVLCKVSDNAPSNTNIVNVAEITKYEDEDGGDIPEDIDSTPDNVDKKNEDDDDYEVVLIKTFDLSLLKWVSTVYVTEDGETKTTQTGNTGDDNTDIIPKVEINRKKINSSIVKFGYTIKITNEGDIEGYAKEITDYVPEGLKFDPEDNKGWEDKGNGTITTRLLENTLLKPGDTAEVTVIFTWINGSENLGLKTNIAEISEDYNKEGIPDRDSTPGNKVWGEDDIDDAQVLLSISTGLVQNIMMYVIAGTIILAVLAGGIFAIRKFVL